MAAAAGFAPACPLWLSVYRLLAEALSAAGPDYAGALDVVRQECAALLHRLPGLERLTFADGTPLADEATHTWLLSLAPLCRSLKLSRGILRAPAQKNVFFTKRHAGYKYFQ